MADENKGQAQPESKKSQSAEKDHDAQMAKQIEEMENDYRVDPTADTVVYPADIGYSAHALHKGPSTSQQFVDRGKYERSVNSDPDRENKLFARDVLGLDVEVEDHPDSPEETYGGKRADQ
jgi:hypothetical protein